MSIAPLPNPSPACGRGAKLDTSLRWYDELKS